MYFRIVFLFFSKQKEVLLCLSTTVLLNKIVLLKLEQIMVLIRLKTSVSLCLGLCYMTFDLGGKSNQTSIIAVFVIIDYVLFRTVLAY